MTGMKTLIPLLIAALTATAIAQEKLTFKTRLGIDFKDVTLTNVEPSGITIETASGLERIPFKVLPDDLQKRFGYDPAKAALHENALAKATEARIARNIAISTAQENAKAREAEAMKDYAIQKFLDAELPRIEVLGYFRPTYFGEKDTGGWFTAVEKVETGTEVRGLNTVPTYGYRRNTAVRAVLDQKMAEDIGAGAEVPTTLYRIGFTKDASRDPLFTPSRERAAAYILERKDRGEIEAPTRAERSRPPSVPSKEYKNPLDQPAR